MNPDGHLAAAAERGQSRTLRGDGKARGHVVKKGKHCTGSRIIFARLNS
jgi:hypothetical protein